VDKIYFNSYTSREDYAVIKDEAFKLDITVKLHISNIISAYAIQKRKEATGKDEIEKQ
jgi:hypothetical protein